MAARELWSRVMESSDDIGRLQQYATLEHLGDSYAFDDASLAEHYYRRLLEENPSRNGTTGTQEIKLAELLLDRGSPADLDEATKLLDQWMREADSPFPINHFRWQLAVIRLAEARGSHDEVKEGARRALELAEMGPVFPRHKDVGLVGADHRTLKKLKRLAN